MKYIQLTVIATLFSLFAGSASAATFSFSRRNIRSFQPDATAVGTITTNGRFRIACTDSRASHDVRNACSIGIWSVF